MRINGIARDIPINERRFDGVNVELSGRLENITPPKHEDKVGLLEYAYNSIPEINQEDIQYMLPAVINEVHLFNDGNGRTSRLLHLLLCNYSSKEEFLDEAKRALGRSGRYNSLDINPELVNGEIELEVLKNHEWVFSEPFVGQLGRSNFEFASAELHQISKDISEEAKEFFRLYKSDQYYAITAIHMLFGDRNVKKLFTDKYRKANPQDLVSPLIMAGALVKDDWQKLIDNFYQLKKEEAKTLVDIFKNPDKHKTKRGDKTLAIKDAFIEDTFIEDIQKRGNFI